MKDYKKYIDENTLRCEASHRGGGIEISLDELLGTEKGFKMGYKMTAFQNYLGGGLLGSIESSYNFEILELSKVNQVKVKKMTDELQRYFHELTNHEGDEWENASFEENQNRPVSAY